MAHNVKCYYCNEVFDADQIEYEKVNSRRYAHKTCFEEAKEKEKLQEALKEGEKKLAAMEQKTAKANLRKCLICGGLIDIKSEECIKATSTRYAHRSCIADSPEQLEKTQFFDYVSQLFGKEYDHASTVKLAEKYKKEYPEWTWSGMQKAIWWFYEKKHGDKKKSRGTIGILPFCYQSALNYFYELYMAELSANSLTEEQTETKTLEITISEPAKPTAKRKAKILEFEEDEE